MDQFTPIVENEAGYLVPSGDLFSDPIVVEKNNGTLTCRCLEAITNLQEPCRHVRAVQDYLAHRESNLTQERVDALLFVVRRLEARMDRNERAARAQIDHITLWLETANGRLDRQRRWILRQCRRWMEREGLKTASLANGVLRIRPVPDRLEILDKEKVLADPRFVRIVPEKREVDRKAIRDHVKATGEVPEGVEFIPQEPRFSCKCYRLEVDHD
jgi:hypothetical protein